MSREKGDRLETYVSKSLSINKTTNSGAKFGNADLADKNIVIECKYKSLPHFRPDKKELGKVIEIAEKSLREWAYIQQTKDDKIYTVIDFEFFSELINCWYDHVGDHLQGL